MAVKTLSSAIKTLALLDRIAGYDSPVRLADLTRDLQESRGTIYQRLMTLVEAGWLEQSEQGVYRLSLHIAGLGQSALEQASFGDRSTSTMRELAMNTGETVSLAVLSGLHVQLVKRIEAPVAVRADVRVGTVLSLSDSSSGRILTAFAELDHIRLLQSKGAQLVAEAELEKIRTQGYALSSGRDVPGVRSAAAPIFDKRKNCIAALSIVVPELRFDAERILPPLLETARRLNNQPY